VIGTLAGFGADFIDVAGTAHWGKQTAGATLNR